MRLITTLILILWSGFASAEPFPPYQSLTVNDYADLLDATAEAQLDQKLGALRQATGIEAVVVTLRTQSDYEAAPSLEAFARRLFDGWKIGDATRNDGILILVLSEDRAARIQLGAGYNPEYDIPAQDIVNRIMVPDFRDGRMAEGIAAGTDAVIAHIAERHAEGLPPAPVKSSDKGATPFIVLGGILIAGFLVIRDRMARKRRAAGAGLGGRPERRDDDRNSQDNDPGRGRANPGSRGSGDSFGGGNSSGGGASGRW